MKFCPECGGSLDMSRDYEAWSNYSVCNSCLNKDDSPRCSICNSECKYFRETSKVILCGDDYCIEFPDAEIPGG